MTTEQFENLGLNWGGTSSTVLWLSSGRAENAMGMSPGTGERAGSLEPVDEASGPEDGDTNTTPRRAAITCDIAY